MCFARCSDLDKMSKKKSRIKDMDNPNRICPCLVAMPPGKICTYKAFTQSEVKKHEQKHKEAIENHKLTPVRWFEVDIVNESQNEMASEMVKSQANILELEIEPIADQYASEYVNYEFIKENNFIDILTKDESLSCQDETDASNEDEDIMTLLSKPHATENSCPQSGPSRLNYDDNVYINELTVAKKRPNNTPPRPHSSLSSSTKVEAEPSSDDCSIYDVVQSTVQKNVETILATQQNTRQNSLVDSSIGQKFNLIKDSTDQNEDNKESIVRLTRENEELKSRLNIEQEKNRKIETKNKELSEDTNKLLQLVSERNDQIREINHRCNAVFREKLGEKQTELEHSKKNVLDLRKQLDDALTQMARYQKSISNLEAENIECKRQRDDLINERDALQRNRESCTAEVERLKRDVRTSVCEPMCKLQIHTISASDAGSSDVELVSVAFSSPQPHVSKSFA